MNQSPFPSGYLSRAGLHLDPRPGKSFTCDVCRKEFTMESRTQKRCSACQKIGKARQKKIYWRRVRKGVLAKWKERRRAA